MNKPVLLSKKDVLWAIEVEPEYPGDSPPALMECIRKVLELSNPELGVLQIARLAVRQTKQCIADRIETLPIHSKQKKQTTKKGQEINGNSNN